MTFGGSVTAKYNFKNFASFSKALERVMADANSLAALEIRNEAVELLADNGDGPVQIRYMPKRKVHVSKPGDPPNSDTGRLQQSIKVERDGVASVVGTNVRYGAYLEFGTQDMAARPWLSRAVRNVARKLPQIYEIAYEKLVKGFKG